MQCAQIARYDFFIVPVLPMWTAEYESTIFLALGFEETVFLEIFMHYLLMSRICIDEYEPPIFWLL